MLNVLIVICITKKYLRTFHTFIYYAGIYLGTYLLERLNYQMYFKQPILIVQIIKGANIRILKKINYGIKYCLPKYLIPYHLHFVLRSLF